MMKGNKTIDIIEENHHDENLPETETFSPTGTQKPYSVEITKFRRYLIMILLWFGQFLIFVSIYSLAPFFPKEAESKNATATEYGMIIGSFQMATLIHCPLFVKLVANHDEKLLIIVGLAASAIATISFGFIIHLEYVQFVAMAFILRITNGIGAASFQVTSYITVAGIFPNNIASAFVCVCLIIPLTFSLLHYIYVRFLNYQGSMETAVGLGCIVGPAFGGFLYEVCQDPIRSVLKHTSLPYVIYYTQLGGFAIPFVVIGGIILLLSFVTIFAIPKREPDGSSMSLKSMMKFTLNFCVTLSILAIFTNEFNTGYLSCTLEPFLRSKFALRPIFIGLCFMAAGGMYAFTTPIWGYLTDKGVGTAILCLVGCIICFVGCVFLGPLPFFPFEPKLWLIILSLILCGLGIAAKMVCAFTGMLHYAEKNGYALDKNTYALTSAIFNSACALGASVGPFIGGAFLEHYDFRIGSYLLAAMELSLGVLYVIELNCFKNSRPSINHSSTIDTYESEEMVTL